MIIARRRPITEPGSGPEHLTLSCTEAENVGDLVGIVSTGKVRKADARDPATLPAIGVVVSKPGPFWAVVQVAGAVRGIYPALSAGKQYVLGADSRPSALPLVVGVETQKIFVQKVGVAVDSTTLSLQISPDFVGVNL